MKKFFSMLVIGSVLTLLVAGTMRAQEPGTVIRASIPFDFIVRGRTLPAGKYEITRISDEPVGLLIRSLDDKRDKAVFETEPVYMRKLARNDELARTPDRLRRQILVERSTALDAESRLERVGPVVEARMNDLAVAARDARSASATPRSAA